MVSHKKWTARPNLRRLGPIFYTCVSDVSVQKRIASVKNVGVFMLCYDILQVVVGLICFPFLFAKVVRTCVSMVRTMCRNFSF